jgi:phosphate-selective porin OprO and OprP
MRTTYGPLLASLAALATAAPLGTTWAAEPTAPVANPPDEASLPPEQRLERRLERAEQRIRELEARLERSEAAQAAAAEPATHAAAASALPAEAPVSQPADRSPALQVAAHAAPPPRALTVTAVDGSNTLRLRGNVAIDWREFTDAATPASASMFLARRVRPVVEGVLAGNYAYRLAPDFGSGRATIQEAWVSGRINDWLSLQFGKFKTPVGLERLQSDQFVRFNELGLPSALEPGRDFGLQASGNLAHDTLSYALGYFGGTVDGSGSENNTNPDLDNDGKRDLAGRLFFKPFSSDGDSLLQGFGFGIGATYVNATGIAGTTTSTLLPGGYRTPGQQAMFTYRGDLADTTPINEATIASGVRRRLAPQAQYYRGPFGLIGQYTMVTQQVQRTDGTGLRTGTLGHHAWLVGGSWFLTGEDAASETFTPYSLFVPGRPGTGAVELVARVHGLRTDDASFAGGSSSFADPATSVRGARAWGAGLNWYLTGTFKLQFNYEVTQFSGGAPGGDRPAERVAITRASLIY